MKKIYFSHDYNSRNDIKLQNLVMQLGYEGLGWYWCIVEMLYEQDGKIELSQCQSIAFALRTDCEKINILINLVFKKNETHFWSNSVLSRLKTQEEKSKVAKKSAQKRWKNEAKKGITTTSKVAVPTDSESNASKVKESKVKKSKEIKIFIADKQRSTSKTEKPITTYERKALDKQTQLQRIGYFLEDTLKTTIVNWGKQAKALKMMLQAGYREEQIMFAIKYLANDEFFEDKGFDLMTVANNIDKIKAKMRKGAS